MESTLSDIADFIKLNLQRLIPSPHPVNHNFLHLAFEQTVSDFRYHFPKITISAVKSEILRNRFLPVFLYRLVRKMHVAGYDDENKYQIHFLMKTLCGCEIYWSSKIGEGFHLDHGVGTVIGSECKIGNGFWIQHGCTVMHKDLGDLGKAPIIGDDVIMYSNSQVLGPIKVGDRTIIAPNSVLVSDTEGNQMVLGNPAKIVKELTARQNTF